MGRSKTLSDDEVLDRLLTALHASGPAGLSFAVASRAAGLAAATLVQRFGTRDAMIEAVLLHAWDQLAAATSAADASAPDNPAGAVAILLQLMPGRSVDDSLSDGLLLLREDLRNPALRARGVSWGRDLARALGRRLTGDAGDAERLGWQLASLWQGALIWQAFRRDADPATRIRSVLEDWCRSVAAGERVIVQSGIVPDRETSDRTRS